jgi:3-hydroxyisobutyrate dehydrogenase
MKLVLNTWLAFEVEATAEAAALAASFAIPEDVLADALDGSPLVSSFASAKLAKLQSGDLRADFGLGMALKDLELVRAARGARHTPVALAIADRWHALVDAGHGDLDVSAAGLDLD